jgi:PAS domain S-box-containing protein
MLDFLTHLFDTSDFRDRWHCGNWTAGHGWLHILSDLGVWSAYFAIPCILGYFVLRRRDIPFRTIFWLFGAFILACGTTHLMEALIFWWPAYRLAGVIKLLTALVSWGTVVALVPTIPKALALRTPGELEREIAARKQAEDALQKANTELETRVEERTAELARANASLRESQRREKERADELEAMLRATPTPIWIAHDPQCHRITGNPASFELLGLPEGTNVSATSPGHDPRMRGFREFRGDQPIPTDELPIQRAARGELVNGAEVKFVFDDGRVRYIYGNAVPLRNPDGSVRGCVGAFADVTALKEAEESLRHNQEVFQLVHQIGRVGHWQWNSLTDENRWSPEIEALYGLKPGTFRGTYDAWAKLLHPDDLPRQEEVVRRAFETGQYFTEFRVIWPDGTVHWLEARGKVFKDGHDKPVRFMGVNMDITERKQADEALRQSEERFRQLAENINEVFWMTDPQTTQLLYISPAYERVWGRSCQSLNENPRSFMDAIHPEDRERVRISVLENQSRGEQTDKEYRVVRPDGSIRWVRDRAFPVNNAAGQFYRLVGIIDDFTDRKNAEEALKEADRRKDEFLAVLAHELRNPLAPLRNGLQILRLAGNDRAAVEQARTMMERQLEHFIRLVDDLLDLSRISRGRIELHKERIELATVLNSAVESCDPLIKQSGHELTVTLPEEPVYLDADRTRLAQVVCNLLTNAAKYSERGSRIWLTSERQGSDAVLSVKDTGIGIPPDMLPRVFEMFTQVGRSLEKTQSGLGIGLSIVKRLVEMHGASVEARSDGPGMGSEFLIRLPVVLTLVHQREQARGDDQQPRPMSRRRILVVDDNLDIADSLAVLLEMMGNEVRTAHDGLEGVAAAAAYRPDMILLDIGMPKLNGYEACRRIREQPWGKGILIAAVTGWGQEEDKRRSHEAGFDHHLIKPVGPAAIEKLLVELEARSA